MITINDLKKQIDSLVLNGKGNLPITQVNLSDGIRKHLNYIKLQFDKTMLVFEQEQTKEALNKNISFKEFIKDLKLTIKTDDGKVIKVEPDNIIGFNDSVCLLEAKLNIINSELDSINTRLNKLDSESNSKDK